MKVYEDKMLELIEKDTQGTTIKKAAWIILYKGNQLTLRSGKRVWAKEGHARKTLSNNIKYNFKKYIWQQEPGEYKKSETVYRETLQILLDKGILEFKQI